jgi:hypothetical protein
MRIPQHPTLIQRMLQARLKKLDATKPVLAASLCAYAYRCGKPSCRCQRGGPLHQGQHLTCKRDGKTRSVYVPKDLLPQVRSWIAEHKRIKQLLNRCIEGIEVRVEDGGCSFHPEPRKTSTFVIR